MNNNIKVEFISASYDIEDVTSLVFEIRIDGVEVGVVYQTNHTEWTVGLSPTQEPIKISVDTASQILDEISNFIRGYETPTSK